MHQVTKSIQTNFTEFEEKTSQTQHHDFCEDKSTETHEKIETIQCFYCGLTIVSESHLKDHRVNCHGMTGLPSKLIQEEDFNLFQCSECGAKCDDKKNLDGHISTYHELGHFYCDICPLKFPTNGHVYFHKLSCHEE